MPKQIQNPNVGQALQRAFGLQGRVQPALDEIIVPTVSIGDLSQGGPPPVARRASVRGTANAAGAGQFGTFRFEVPGSIIARVDRIWFRASAATSMVVGFSGAGGPLAGTGIKSFTDGRLTEEGQFPASTLTFGTRAAGIGGQAWLGRALVDGSYFTPNGWVVGSGLADQFGFLEFQIQTDNLQFQLTVEFTEYTMV